jgi:hypothetical protein
MTGKDGREWMRANLGNTNFYNISGSPTRSFVVGDNVFYDFEDINGEKRQIVHELAHALDFKTGNSLLGGGISSSIITSLGGNPGFIPLIDRSPYTLPQEYQFSPEVLDGLYGQGSTIEFFAVGLSMRIYEPGVLNPMVKSSFDAMILVLNAK